MVSAAIANDQASNAAAQLTEFGKVRTKGASPVVNEHWPMRVVLHLVLLLSLVIAPSWRAQASSYVCDGDALTARIDRGAVDAIGIPNSVDGTVPGSFVVLEWRDLHLQLPRTNNAGAPSFSDGKWWWDLTDSQHPGFKLRQGAGRAQLIACDAAVE